MELPTLFRKSVAQSCAAIGVLASLTLPAAAQQPFTFLSGDWLVTVKGNVVASPSYPGASEMSVLPYPSLSLRRAGTPESFSAPDDTISFALYDAGWLKAGPAGRFVGARRAKDHRELVGLRDIDWTIEAGAFAEFWPTEKLRTRAELRYGFHGHRGVVADFGADWVERFGAWTISGGPRLRVGSDRYMASYFSVSPAEALINTRVTPFDAKGGLASAGLAAAITYKWSEQWRTTLHGRWDRLTGDAGRSPIPTQLGSRNQFTVGATLAYTFSMRIP
jgi:outer membrane scaffolding protein for murein synthesis (MipA/OmpV family)